jgi:hypothetical protein
VGSPLPRGRFCTRARRHQDRRWSRKAPSGLTDQLCESDIGRTSGRPVELDPGRGVNEDQVLDGR